MTNPEPELRARALDLYRKTGDLAAEVESFSIKTEADAARRFSLKPKNVQAKEKRPIDIGSGGLRRAIDALKDAERELSLWVTFRARYDHELK